MPAYGPWPANGTQFSGNDSPEMFLPVDGSATEAYVNDNFRTYMMYLPPICSAYANYLVPLYEIDWGWSTESFLSVQLPYSWSAPSNLYLLGPPYYDTTAVQYPAFPQWTVCQTSATLGNYNLPGQ